MKVILASSSPRRQELFKKIFDNFEIQVSNVDESISGVDPLLVPQILAKRKGEAVFQNNEDALIVAADTIVLLDDEILNKPKDENDACRMLSLLSNNTHKVITGCFIKSKDKEKVFSEITKVTFNKLSDENIKAYIKTKEPLDKAGAYGIQGKGSSLVKEIEGDYFNVVGLPVDKLKEQIREFI